MVYYFIDKVVFLENVFCLFLMFNDTPEPNCARIAFSVMDVSTKTWQLIIQFLLLVGICFS